ncbi:hypothetical protein C8J57DRAFT_1240189 [Mycena rebaudengoi]|nr:hypothetical protein C8J57DRAFT_1240189 [Mycena rebaudengoi]
MATLGFTYCYFAVLNCYFALYGDSCRLLSMLPKARKRIQDGTEHDKYRLAVFAADLHTLLPPGSGPLSGLVSGIVNEMPQLPNGWPVFRMYFAAADRCSNPIHHRVGGETDSLPGSFRVAVKSKLKRATCPHWAIPGKAQNHFCVASRYNSASHVTVTGLCQKESWKGGKTPHRDVCPILAQIVLVQKDRERTTGKPDGVDRLYFDAGITSKEVEAALGGVTRKPDGLKDITSQGVITQAINEPS